MHHIIRQFNLQPGDSIVVPKSDWKIIEHYIVFLGCDEYGNEWCAENHNVSGVRIVLAKEVLTGIVQVNRVKRFKGNKYERKAAVQKALAKAGKPYSLINYNCEHFSNEIQTGIPSSSQAGWGIGIVAAISLLLIFRS